jgi:hypothetical protein
MASQAGEPGLQTDSNGPHGSCRSALCTIMPFGPAIGPGLAR